MALDFPVAQPGSESAERTKAISNHLVRGLNGFGGVRIFDMRPDPSEDSPYVIRLRFLDAAADQVEDQMELRLLDRGSGEIMWSKVLPLADEGILMLELDKAVVALVGSHGEIAQIEMSKLKDDYSAGYPCLLQFDSYIRYREPQKRKPVLECLENSVGLFPNDAHLLSILAFGANMQRGFDFESKYSGMDIARQAEALDHHSAMANFVIAQSAFLAGDCVTGAAWGKKAVQLNPQDPRISGYLGLYMIGCKDLDGEKYAARALELDPNADLTVAAAVAFQMLKRRDAEAAKQLSSEYIASSPRYDPSLELTYILSSAMLDDREEARRAWKILTGRYGLTEKSPAREVLSRWIVSPFLIDEIMTVFDGVGMAEKMG
ncbi:hypothetical protein [Parasphingorhabdus sp.]|uniref:tetratricopeptide repeat protein n=1 Tax=Parasphingorhabdus sp. TaxID=2709688 RepID=UPI003267EC4B